MVMVWPCSLSWRAIWRGVSVETASLLTTAWYNSRSGVTQSSKLSCWFLTIRVSERLGRPRGVAGTVADTGSAPGRELVVPGVGIWKGSAVGAGVWPGVGIGVGTGLAWGSHLSRKTC